MLELFDGLDFVQTCIDVLLALTKGTFEDHLEKLERVLFRLKESGLKVNAKKSFFAKTELECIGHWITRASIKPLPDKVKAILALDVPRNRRELRSFIGIVNYYRDMWIRQSHVLDPLASLTSNKTKWSWGPQQQAAFEPFITHADASHCQLGAAISQDGKPVAFHS